MRTLKKIGALLLAVCLAVPCFSLVASASDGRISFSDPQTKVGDMVEVKCAVRSTGDSLGSMEINISYDTESLRYDNGESVEDNGDGTLTLTGNGGSAEQIFLMNFQALKEGTTQITINDSTVTSAAGAEMTFDLGSSSVQIGPGDPSKIVKPEETDKPSSTAEDVEVEVDGVTYTLTDDFSDGDIPNGYVRTQVDLDGQQRQMVTSETSGVTLGYLLNENVGDFFVFNEENATFSPYAELSISDTTSIVLLSDASQVTLPEGYVEAQLTLNQKSFPVWQNGSEKDYYVIYAVNNNGESGFYRYDTLENTYQRIELESGEKEDAAPGGLLGKIQNFIETYIQLIVLIGGLGGILILLIILILAVKLHNRNVELDELYEEYGIGDEEPEPVGKKQKKSRRYEDEDDFDTDGIDLEDEFPTDEIDLEDDFDTDSLEEAGNFETGEMDLEDDFESDELESEEDFDTADLNLREEFGDYLEIRPNDEKTVYRASVSDNLDDTDSMYQSYDVDTGFLDEVDSDEFVVYGGESRTDELTIDDLDELLSDEPKKLGHSEPDDTFKVDFIDLD